MNGYSRTYAADHFNRAMAMWATYGPEWDEVRRASSLWTVYPPSSEGSEYRDDPHPSQRAIVWSALRDRPAETLEVIRISKSWRDVVGWILEAEEQLDQEASRREREATQRKAFQRRADERAYEAIRARFGGTP